MAGVLSSGSKPRVLSRTGGAESYRALARRRSNPAAAERSNEIGDPKPAPSSKLSPLAAPTTSQKIEITKINIEATA